MAVREHGLFRLVDHPSDDVAQGGCYVSHDSGPGVDTGVLIEFEGTLFLCLNTIKEIAEVAGFSVNVEGAALEVENAELQRKIEVLEDERDDMRAQLDAVALAVAHAANVQARAEKPSTKAK